MTTLGDDTGVPYRARLRDIWLATSLPTCNSRTLIGVYSREPCWTWLREVWVAKTLPAWHNMTTLTDENGVPGWARLRELWVRKAYQTLQSMTTQGGDPWVPRRARARGLWGGPEPTVLRILTYVERQILTLARVYVVVKRMMTKDW